jgi:hypothetical protein
MASTITLDGFAVDDAGWGWGEGFVGTFLVFGDCELEGAIGSLMGPGLNSTLALGGAGGIALGLDVSFDPEVVVGGVEKEQAGRKNVCERIVVLRYE